MKKASFLLTVLFFPVFAFASEFNSAETACGFGESNAAHAIAYAESSANAQCEGLFAIRVSEWQLTDSFNLEDDEECTKAEATFTCP